MFQRVTEMTRLKGFLYAPACFRSAWATEVERHPAAIEPCPGVLPAFLTGRNVTAVTLSLCISVKISNNASR
jgi:hypothetical protein